MPLLVLNEDELRQTITIPEAIDVVKDAFAASAESRMNLPGDFTLNLPGINGEVDVTGAYLQETPYYVVKVASNFHDNPAQNLQPKSGLIAVFDASTGFPAAVMVDNGYLTNIRAGAAGAIAADLLANDNLGLVAILGSGSQAYIQLKTLMAVRRIKRVMVWDRSPLQADNYARRMVEDHDLDIQIAPSVEAAVTQADLIVTATASIEPLVQAAWLKPGVHITAVGSNNPVKQELGLDVLQRADLIVVDNLDQCATSGEIHHGLKSGAVSAEMIQGELSSLIIGTIPGRTSSDQITLADLTGLDSQDAVVATLAMEKALFYGLGQRIEMGLGQRGPNSPVGDQ
jgi:ornithine cyclodeaminase